MATGEGQAVLNNKSFRLVSSCETSSCPLYVRKYINTNAIGEDCKKLWVI